MSGPTKLLQSPPIKCLGLISIIVHFTAFVGWAQKEGSRPFLNTVPPDRVFSTPASRETLEKDGDVMRRVAATSRPIEQTGFVGEGTVTVHNADGVSEFVVKVLRNGPAQTVLIRGAGEKDWIRDPAKLDSSARRVLEFVQTQFDRGLPALLKASERNASLLDGGMKDGTQALVVQETDGVATRYVIDNATSRLNRIELQRGNSPDSSGKLFPNLESYVFSDYRSVASSATAFKVVHYTNGTIREELSFATVRSVTVTPQLPAPRSGGKR